MAQRQLLRAAAAFAVTARSLATLPTTAERIAADECWDTEISGTQTYYPSGFQAQSESDVADLFEIVYADTFKVVISKIAKEQYVLTQCGQSQPTDDEVNAVAALGLNYIRKHFSVPIQSSMAMSTVQLGFLDALGVQDRVSYVGQYAVAPCWQKALGCGAQIEDSYATDFNATHLAWQKSSVDVIFMDCGLDCSDVNGMSNGVHVPTSLEDGMVATAEYIKYMGAFFNKEPEANTLFSATKIAYQQAASGATNTPVVAWISYNAYGGPNWDEPEFKVSQAAYKTALVTDAGGANFAAETELASVPGLTVSNAVWGNAAAGKTYAFLLSAFNGSADNTADDVKTNASAYFTAALASADVVIDETYAWNPNSYNFDSFLSMFGLTSDSDLKFVKNQMVLRFDRTMSSSYGLDWYESRIAKPDWALEGLAYSMHGDTSKRAKYFRNVAKGETPDQVLEADMCLATLPTCVAEANPATIPLDGPSGEPAEDDHDDHDDHADDDDHDDHDDHDHNTDVGAASLLKLSTAAWAAAAAATAAAFSA